MKNLISLVLIAFLLTGCSAFRVHKIDVDQGNILNEQEVERLRPGMSQEQVKEIMGTPVLVNIFTPNRVEYVYTFQSGYEKMKEKRVLLIFQNGRLRDISKFNNAL